jgi:uncharacterized protein with FMN-binding domain
MIRSAKKIGVATFVALTFVIYSIHQRSEGSQATSQVSQPSSATSASPSSSPASTSSSSQATTGQYKNGTYTGASSDAFYGYIQVQATISGGKLTDVQFLDFPQDRRDSIEINDSAMPQLKQQAIQAQSAQVDGVSGATDTSQAFMQSLGDALQQAQS